MGLLLMLLVVNGGTGVKFKPSLYHLSKREFFRINRFSAATEHSPSTELQASR